METTPTTPVTVAATDIYDGAPSSLAHGRYARCLHREAETWVAPVPAADLAAWRELQSGHDWPGAMWVARHAPQGYVRCAACAADLAAGRRVLVRVGGSSSGGFFLVVDSLGIEATGEECPAARRALERVGVAHSPVSVRADCRGSARHIGAQERVASRGEIVAALEAAVAEVEESMAANPAVHAVRAERGPGGLRAALAALRAAEMGVSL